MAMTLRQFVGMLEQMTEIQKIEYGGDKETPLSGEAGFALARRIFPRGRGRR